MRLLLLSVVLLGFAIDSPARAQNTDPSASGIQARGEEVIVDVIVRDKKGRAVTDLGKDDFALSDDGQRRVIRSFRLVQGTDAVTDGGSRAHLDPLRQLRLVSLVFDRMDQAQRALARRAALDLLNQDFPQNVFMAVFSLDLKLNAIQPFTNNRELLRKAIERATDGAYTQFGSDSAHVRQQLEQFTGPNQSGKQDYEERVSSTAVSGEDSPTGAADHAMAELLLNMLNLDERAETDESGRSSIFGLLAAVRGQMQFPGRKALLYFSPGFVIPQGMEQPFRNVIGSANRANVSFYPIDAHGLQTTGQNVQATARLAAGAAASSGAIAAGNGVLTVENGGISIQSALSTDTAMDSGRYNIQDTLAILGAETGGFLVANTNDFRGPLHRITEEIETYYELTYLPEIEKYDGSFRRISVTSSHPDLRIQSRAGYFALPRSASSGVLDPYEVPLLGALGTTPLPNAFPFETAGFHYRGEGRDQTIAYVVDLPLNKVTILKDPKTGIYMGGLSYLALIKNNNGEVVKKLHGNIPLQLRDDQLGSVGNSRFTDAEYFDVPPGRYTVETAVLDRDGQKVSARKSVVIVPKPQPSLSLSSVALIRSWRAKEPDAGEDDPFVYGDRVLTPTLTPVVVKSASNSLPFYLIIYPDVAQTEKPEVTVEFTRDSNSKRIGTAPVAAPDARGRIQYVVTAPIDSFDPGNYEVRFTVKQGNEIARESIAVLMEP